MMDKELIAMCNCEDIQEKCEPIMGGLFYTAAVLHVIADIHNSGKFTLVSRPKLGEWLLYRTEGIFIPRIEDVLEWLGDLISGVSRELNGHNVYGWIVSGWHKDKRTGHQAHNCHWADTSIKALLKAFMHLEHGKTWDGAQWAG